jgi:hypothetical protein
MALSFVMTKDEREAFLAEMHVGIIAINERDRAPLAVPVWYAYEPGGDIQVVMQNDSRKMVGIEASGRFSLCAQQEAPPYKYVTAEGPVTHVRPYGIDTDLLPIATRYLGEQGGRDYAAGASNDNGVILSMTPEHWLSTDYGKH